MNDNYLSDKELNEIKPKTKINWYDIVIWGLILSGLAIFFYWFLFK